MEAVIGLLKAQNDSADFVPIFIEHYGYPLWHESVFIEEGEQVLIFVPVEIHQEEIESIWVFKVSGDWVDYYLVHKELVQEKDRWSFDYFTQEALGKRPRSGMRFETDNREVTTRAIVENETCTQGFAGVEMDGVIVEVSTGWHCWTTISFVSTPPDGIGGTGDGGGGLSGGGGSGGGGTTPPLTTLDADLETLFEGNCSLSEEELEKLNDVFNEMLEECFYNYINNYLLQKNVKLRNILIMEPGWPGQAAIDDLKDLKFADIGEINSFNLKHEWTHLFQKQYHNITLYGERKGMAEFEVALVQDILKFIEIGGDWETTAYVWSTWARRMEEYKDEYMAWLSELTNKGTTYPTAISNAMFQYFSNAFGEVSISYNKDRGYTYGNENYTPSAAQALFNQAKSSCGK